MSLIGLSGGWGVPGPINVENPRGRPFSSLSREKERVAQGPAPDSRPSKHPKVSRSPPWGLVLVLRQVAEVLGPLSHWQGQPERRLIPPPPALAFPPACPLHFIAHLSRAGGALPLGRRLWKGKRLAGKCTGRGPAGQTLAGLPANRRASDRRNLGVEKTR